jgi:hypothetical protein
VFTKVSTRFSAGFEIRNVASSSRVSACFCGDPSATSVGPAFRVVAPVVSGPGVSGPGVSGPDLSG